MTYLYIAAAIPLAVLVVWAACELLAWVCDAVDRHIGRDQ